MPETVFGRIEQFSGAEMLNTITGAVLGTGTHIVGESLADNYFEPKYPDKYPVYSTAATSAVITVAAGGLWYFARGKPAMSMVQYLVAGFILVEVVQLLDLIRVSFELGG